MFVKTRQQPMQQATNTLFTLAADFIQYTNRSVFLTGKAGTGKTTFLKHIRSTTPKQTVVVAPTGVAAINAGGVTIHSFFQLPFTPFVPGHKGFSRDETIVDRHALISRLKINSERKKVFRQLELLVIDEISMVRCDVLDAVDAVLRHFRNKPAEPFGGVQVLYIGDMFQLPPVVPDNEWQILSAFYSSPYFFDSKVIEQQEPVHIELNKVYRQSDQYFIELLNMVRNNEMTEASFAELNKLYKPSFNPGSDAGYITLSTHNNKADAINSEELTRIGSKAVNYKANITGDFSEKSYPADEVLQLKNGAQVMFTRNDKEKRYYNGKIGIITELGAEVIKVQCKDEPEPIEVKRETWENIRYTLNNASQQVEDEVVGTFEQFPLRLAWAITIHKSQGLTFEKAIIDAGAAFAPGQVYVALSRCTTMQGIVLKSQVTARGIISDPHINRFAAQKQSANSLSAQLASSKGLHERKTIREVFTLSAIARQAEDIIKVVDEHPTSFNAEARPWLQGINAGIAALYETARKFEAQLMQLFTEDVPIPAHELLQQRIIKASAYFVPQLQSILQQLPASPAVTDSRTFATEYNEELNQLHALISQKIHHISLCTNGFDATLFSEQKNKLAVTPLQVNAHAGAKGYYKTNNPHLALYMQLKELRDEICREEDAPIYIIAKSETLDEMARYLPQTPDELKQVSGFGKAKIEKYGSRFLKFISDYSVKNNLSSQIHTKESKKQKKEKLPATSSKPDTREETYKLHKDGKSIEQIAKERNLTVSTIEGHLAHYVQKGILNIHEVVTREKFLLIEPLTRSFEGGSITPIKTQLGDSVSWGEIKLVLASKGIEGEAPVTAQQ
ncbi:MAG TPA: helix-turn-helix domain-containing protein [Chitinophagaceae bacterium]|nr:helix-turn-helix domain-containing protein [Chitinophagaceae bacterium]